MHPKFQKRLAGGRIDFIDPYFDVFELRQVLGDRREKVYLAFFRKHHRCHGCNWLRHRINAKDGVQLHGDILLTVLETESMLVNDFAVARHHNYGAGYVTFVDLGLKKLSDAIETFRGKAAVFGMGGFGQAQSEPWVAADLASAIRKNPHLKVFSANGYFDLATPFYATEFDLAHMNLEPALRGNVQFGYYLSGHMIYLNVDALRQLKGDMAKFISASGN